MFLLYIIIVLVISIYTFIIYGVDKKRAIENKWRISEKRLLLSSVFFGALGGLIGMYTFRHKTEHWYFGLINIVSLLAHVAILGVIIKYVGVTGFTNFFGKLSL